MADLNSGNGNDILYVKGGSLDYVTTDTSLYGNGTVDSPLKLNPSVTEAIEGKVSKTGDIMTGALIMDYGADVNWAYAIDSVGGVRVGNADSDTPYSIAVRRNIGGYPMAGDMMMTGDASGGYLTLRQRANNNNVGGSADMQLSMGKNISGTYDLFTVEGSTAYNVVRGYTDEHPVKYVKIVTSVPETVEDGVLYALMES